MYPKNIHLFCLIAASIGLLTTSVGLVIDAIKIPGVGIEHAHAVADNIKRMC